MNLKNDSARTNNVATSKELQEAKMKYSQVERRSKRYVARQRVADFGMHRDARIPNKGGADLRKPSVRNRARPAATTQPETSDNEEFVVMEYACDGPLTKNPRERLVKRHVIKAEDVRRFMEEIGAIARKGNDP